MAWAAAWGLQPLHAVSPPILQGALQIKATLAWRLCVFTEWPDKTGAGDPARPFLMGVMGSPPQPGEDPGVNLMVRALIETTGTRKINGHRIEIRPIRTPSDFLACQAVFVLPSLKTRLQKLVQIAWRRGILLISDAPGAADVGVHINLVPAGDFIGYEVNETAFRASGLKLDFRAVSNAVAIKRTGVRP